MMTINELIAEIERLDAEATKVWIPKTDSNGVDFVVGDEDCKTIICDSIWTPEDKQFIVRARTLLPLCGRILKAVETHMQISSCACPNWFKKELAKILEVQND